MFSVSDGGDDGHGDHHQAGGAPHVLHEELFQHDVPEALQQDLMDLRGQRRVAPPQLGQLHLQIKHTHHRHGEFISDGENLLPVIQTDHCFFYLVSSIEGNLL